MADLSLPAGPFAPGDFRVGRAFSRAWSVFWRNILKFSLVGGVPSLPTLLFSRPGAANPLANPQLIFLGLALMILLNLLAQAIIFHGTFQYMRRRPVNLSEGVRVGLRRFFPLIGLGLVWLLVVLGLALITGLLVSMPVVNFATPLMVIAFVILLLTWLMAAPACVVERTGPFRSLGRSGELTEDHRWKILGLLLLALIPAFIVGAIVGGVAGAITVLAPMGDLSTAVAQTIVLIWRAMWLAFLAVIFVVAYHDLRVAKEGIDTDGIVEVFE
jgi:hypothetical protein